LSRGSFEIIKSGITSMLRTLLVMYLTSLRE